MRTLFISDLHLDESRPDLTEAFYQFLATTAKDAEALYILGDFFEAWVGDDEDSELSRQVVQALKAYSDSGPALYVMHGNRDFLLGDRFCTETGATLVDEGTVINLYGQAVLLLHGDSLCIDDTAYMAFRGQARDPQWQAGFLAQPLEQRRAIAAQIREQSKAMNADKSDEIMDVNAAEVERQMTATGVTEMIHGHTHRPQVHQITICSQPAQRFVLGDWDKNLWYIEASPSALELIKKPIN